MSNSLTKKRKILLLSTGLIVALSAFFISYGYAALNTELSISGEGYVRVDADIRITNLRVIETSSGSYETYNNKYSKNTTSTFVTLPNKESYIIYEVEVTNKSNLDYLLTKITSDSYTNQNIAYEILDINILDVIGKKTVKKFKIKLSNKAGYTNQSTTIVLNYLFETDKVVAPVLTGGSSDWTASAKTISIKTAGTATSGVKNYEYYVTTSTTKPSSSTTATGTTSNTVQISTVGTSYIYYRTVSKLGNKSNWSSAQTIKIDKTAPQIAFTVGTDSSKVGFTFKATDNVQVSSIKKSQTTVATGTSNSLNYTLNTTTDLNGIKITATDAAGNSTTKTVYLKFLFSDGNNPRTANTGGWATNYYYNQYGNIADVYYDTTDNRMILSANPTSAGQGRLGNFYTKNKISLSLYDTIQTTFWVDKASTGKLETRLDGNLLVDDDFTTRPLSSRGNTEVNGGYWVILSGNISSFTNSQTVVLGTNGNIDKYIRMYVAISYLYSVK